MAGNVWEICNDLYHFNAYRLAKENGSNRDHIGPTSSFDPYSNDSSPKHSIRGGSFLCNDSYCSGYRTSRRLAFTVNTSAGHLGFRSVKGTN